VAALKAEGMVYVDQGRDLDIDTVKEFGFKNAISQQDLEELRERARTLEN